MALARSKTKARGASNKPLKPSRRSVLDWTRDNYQRALAKVIPATLVLLLALVAVGVHQTISLLLAQPVTRVAVNGEFRHVDKQAIAAEVQPFLADGFVMLDLSGIRQQLVQQPWIFDVTVSRQWPDEIVINVTEQTVIALWGENALVNHRGELFHPRSKVVVSGELKGLPHLSGPKNSEDLVMSHFGELQEMLQRQNLVLRRLAFSGRGSWSAHLDGGIDIVLGSNEVMEKMQRFVSAYQQGLAADFNRLATVDMRYSNGFAIGWKALEKQG